MVQGYGRIDTAHNIDMAALSAHKIYGPKGIGALWIRKDVRINSISHGGGQERGLRSGTLSSSLCTGFGMAAHLMQKHRAEDIQHIRAIRDAIEPLIADWNINGDSERRYEGNLNMRMDGLDVARLMSDLRHISFSAGSACASGSGRTSHVLRAINLSDAQAKNTIRLGFGRYSDSEEIIEAVQTIDRAAKAQISEML
jgi:cysteine desulfurase